REPGESVRRSARREPAVDADLPAAARNAARVDRRGRLSHLVDRCGGGRRDVELRVGARRGDIAGVDGRGGRGGEIGGERRYERESLGDVTAALPRDLADADVAPRRRSFESPRIARSGP